MSDFVSVARLEDVTDGRGLMVMVSGRQVALLREGEKVFALDNVCPHKGASLSFGWVTKGVVACPMHGWEFDCRTGKCSDHSTASVRHYEVKIESGDVFVKVV